MYPTLIEARNISKIFGGVRALQKINLDIKKGEILGLIGPNGSGKTTFIRVCMNLYKPSEGYIKFDGKKITGLSSHKTCRLGISMTNQIPKIFERMTCLQNVVVGGVYGAGLDLKEAEKQALELLESVQLKGKENIIASKLTEFERKLLEFAMALSAKPSFLMLDEPLAGSTEAEISYITSLIRRINSEGVTILWVEHVLSEVFKIVDRVIVFNQGMKILEGKPQEVANSKTFIDAYIGDEVA